MARRQRLESRASMQATAACLSAMLHAGLVLLIAFPGGRQLGVISTEDAPVSQLVMLQALAPDTPAAGPARAPTGLPTALAARAQLEPQPQAIQLPTPALPAATDEPDSAESLPLPVTPDVEEDAPLARALETAPTIAMPTAEAASLLRRIDRLARRKLSNKPRAMDRWSEDGRQYEAKILLERDRDGLEADRVIAEVTAVGGGKRLRTRLMLRRLTYAQFAQIVDRWDPMVQLHDDQVVGPTHINTSFNVLADDEASPALIGKVSTAAPAFSLRSAGGTGASEVFRGGIRTDARRISLADQVDSLEEMFSRTDARVYEFDVDTHLLFRSDGSYSWRSDAPDAAPQHHDADARPVYFIAGPGATISVQGIVAGKVLVYSPQGIVVEGSLTYAHDPRTSPDCEDYLGLVSGRDIAIAPPAVTGPGDVEIHAALFARRLFVVTQYMHRPSATLRIYGSLAAGSVTASEPRYGFRIEFDPRFERRRPPGFPSMNRYRADDWDARWTELPEQAAAGTL